MKTVTHIYKQRKMGFSVKTIASCVYDSTKALQDILISLENLGPLHMSPVSEISPHL